MAISVRSGAVASLLRNTITSMDGSHCAIAVQSARANIQNTIVCSNYLTEDTAIDFTPHTAVVRDTVIKKLPDKSRAATSREIPGSGDTILRSVESDHSDETACSSIQQIDTTPSVITPSPPPSSPTLCLRRTGSTPRTETSSLDSPKTRHSLDNAELRAKTQLPKSTVSNRSIGNAQSQSACPTLLRTRAQSLSIANSVPPISPQQRILSPKSPSPLSIKITPPRSASLGRRSGTATVVNNNIHHKQPLKVNGPMSSMTITQQQQQQQQQQQVKVPDEIRNMSRVELESELQLLRVQLNENEMREELVWLRNRISAADVTKC
jgi:hypothetical protein